MTSAQTTRTYPLRAAKSLKKGQDRALTSSPILVYSMQISNTKSEGKSRENLPLLTLPEIAGTAPGKGLKNGCNNAAGDHHYNSGNGSVMRQ